MATTVKDAPIEEVFDVLVETQSGDLIPGKYSEIDFAIYSQVGVQVGTPVFRKR